MPYNISKHSKSFSDTELFLMCMLDVADQVCPQYRHKFEEVSLLREIVTCSIEAIGKDLTSDLLKSRVFMKSPAVGNLKKFEINSCESMLFTNHITKKNNNNINLFSTSTDASNVGLCLVNLLRLT